MLSHFQRLLDDRQRLREMAREIESPNSEDDDLVKLAIAGFCCHRPVEHWGFDEFEFVSQRRHEVADFDAPWVEFVCLAAGYLLGLLQDGKLIEAQGNLFEAQLPGFMWLHSECFTTS